MTNTNPSRYWLAVKNDTAVKKFDTKGKTKISLPDGLEAVACEDAKELGEIKTDPSVLNDKELEKLGL